MISVSSFISKTKIFLKFRKEFYGRLLSSSTLIKEEKIKVSKWNINYIKVGTGRHHVLCLPGALGTIWTDFKPQIEGFDREQFTLVVWDPPGYGKSRPPDKTFTADFHHKDADYAFEFMKALQIPKYSMIGWSDGGVSSLIHAAKYPDTMIKLVGISTSSYMLPEKKEFKDELRDLSTWSEKMQKTMTEVYGDSLARYWNHWVDGIDKVFSADNGNICTHLLKDIKCPTFILYGEKDLIVPPVNPRDIVKNVAGSISHVYPDGKHNIHLKYAADFNKRVQGFLLQP